MSRRMILTSLLSSLFLLAALPAQHSGPIGESMRVQITGSAGLRQALADQGVIGDHVEVHQQGAWHTATAIVGRDELRDLRAALPPGTLFMVLERSQPYRDRDGGQGLLGCRGRWCFDGRRGARG